MKLINSIKTHWDRYFNTKDEDDDNHLEYYHNNVDEEDNRITSPPKDESIYLSTIWAIEAYTPSYYSNLETGIKKLGWDNNEAFRNQDVIDTVRNWRYRSYGGGYLNLGIIYPPNKNTIPPTRNANLPDGIKWINADIFQLLPSCTILCCQFGLTEELQESIEEPLRKNYSTYSEKIKTGHRIFQVANQKKDEVQLVRETIRSLCSTWIKNNIPGFFSDYSSTLPTGELILLDKNSPFDQVGEKPYKSYLNILGFKSPTEAYKSKDVKGLYLIPPDRIRNAKSNLVLAGNVEEVLEGEDLSMFGDVEKKEGIIRWVNYLGKSVTMWGLYELTKLLEKQLGKLRDKYGSLDIHSEQNLFESLQSIENEFIELQKNSIPLVNELKDYCENESYFHYNLLEPTPVERIHNDQLDYFERIRNLLMHFSESFSNNIEQIRSIADRVSNLVSAATTSSMNKTNLKLQRRMIWFTGILIILTLRLVIPDKTWNQIVNFFSNLLGL